VNDQSWDHALNVDGWADEVFAHVDMKVVEKDTILEQNQRATTVMGDLQYTPPFGFTYPNRIMAGSAKDYGGLKTGDSFPSLNPYTVNEAALAAFGSDGKYGLPMTIYEGELTPDRAVHIIPSIWEWDPGTDVFQGWLRAIAEYGPAIVASWMNIKSVVQGKPIGEIKEGDFVKTNLQEGLKAVVGLFEDWFGNSRSRPIGTKKMEGDQVQFESVSLTINSTIADYLISRSTSLGPGVWYHTYEDHPDFRGKYTIYIHVKRFDPPLSSEQWIKALIPDLLQRPVQQNDIDRYTTLMKEGWSFDRVADDLLYNKAFAEKQVPSYYRNFLGREPREDELSYWTDRLVNRAPLQELALALCNSDEFKTQNPLVDAWVRALFLKLLHQEPNAVAFAFVKNMLQFNPDTQHAIRTILTSEMYCIKEARECYIKYLRRREDDIRPEEPVGWANQMRQGKAKQEIIKGFITSDEYKMMSKSL
jgi:Domain of unknown function (DUF4214)